MQPICGCAGCCPRYCRSASTVTTASTTTTAAQTATALTLLVSDSASTTGVAAGNANAYVDISVFNVRQCRFDGIADVISGVDCIQIHDRPKFVATLWDRMGAG